MSYDSEVAADSPVAYWKLAETAGSTLADSSGNGHTATILNATGLTLGADGLLNEDGATGGRCLVRASATADIQTATSTSANDAFDLSAFTLEAVVKPSGVSGGILGRGGLWSFGQNGVNKFSMLLFDAGGGTTSVPFTSTFVTGTKYHVAVTWTGTVLRTYVNGVLDRTNTPGVPPTFAVNSDAPVILAGSFLGSVEKLAVYGSVLTATRLLAHVTAGNKFGLGLSGGSGFQVIVPVDLSLSGGSGFAVQPAWPLSLSGGSNMDANFVPVEFPGPDPADLPTFEAIPAAKKIRRRSDLYPDPVFVDGRLVSPWEAS